MELLVPINSTNYPYLAMLFPIKAKYLVDLLLDVIRNILSATYLLSCALLDSARFYR